MDTSLFDYDLPESAIAQTPADRRDESRLLLFRRATGEVSHHVFRDIVDLLPRETRLFRNHAAVLPARLRGRRRGGGAVECLLLSPDTDPARWWCLVRPGKKLPIGYAFTLGDDATGTILAKKEGGETLVGFTFASATGSVRDLALKHGEMPLPPYIRREGADDPRAAFDRERYQTVYADPSRTVAAAAPTAGLHFTPAVMQALGSRGHAFHDVCLHVGLGTFKPIQSETIEGHEIHREFYEIPAPACAALRDRAHGPRLCVGTTSLRACEDFARKCFGNEPSASELSGGFSGEAGLFVYPPSQFLSCDALLTNFHLPRSTLLCLVSAFLTPGSTDGIRQLLDLYREAIAKGYRFYSYGDAMLIL